MFLSNISVQNLEELRFLLSRWSVGRNSLIGRKIREYINEDSNGEKFKFFFKFLTSDIIMEVKERLSWLYKHPHLGTEAISAACISYSGLILYRTLTSFPRREDHIRDKKLDTNIILLYLGADFLLDDTEVDPLVKKELVRCIDDEIMISEDPRVQSILDIYTEILNEEPLAKEGIIEAWKSEKEAEKQKSSVSSPEDYEDLFEFLWEISADKGHKTVSMANKILNSGEDREDAYIIGSLTQHVDDLVDHESDKNAGINTSATISMKEGECLDKYIFRCIKEACSLVNVPLMGMMYVQIICNCGFYNKYTSEEMKHLLGNFLLFDKYRKFENFIKILTSEN